MWPLRRRVRPFGLRRHTDGAANPNTLDENDTGTKKFRVKKKPAPIKIAGPVVENRDASHKQTRACLHKPHILDVQHKYAHFFMRLLI